ncbi:MAG TPA: glycosyltransferase family 39 protein [Gemmatimonadaceae bacterium]|nr:glycosyltransferase family 39 protein [Gemmatimonadaceae bacterium]
MSVGELFRTFSSPNQHLMNSLLELASVTVFGQHDWSVRLPAAVFGILTVPAMYLLARPVMNGWQSLSVAFLTAVSYHHVWFSQNARGYSGYLLFCVLATAALWRVIETPNKRWIWTYGVSTTFAVASLIIAAFVVPTHVALAAAVVFVRHRRGEAIAPLVRRLALAFGITAVGGLILYGPTAIQLLRVVGTAYVKAGTGFQPVSLEFVLETLRGLSAGFGSLALVGAIPFLALVAVGTISLMRRAWVIVLSFIVPLLLMAAVVVMAGWLTSPRFFILIVPLAFLVAVESLDLVARMLAQVVKPEQRQRVHGLLAGAAVAVCAVALGFGLPRYYAIPKQPFKASIAAFTARAQPGDAVIAMYQAFWGFDYYSRQLGVDKQDRFFSAPTAAAFDSLGRQLAGRRVFLATTMERAFKLEQPDMWKRVEDGWTRVSTLPATVGYGEISLWEPKH